MECWKVGKLGPKKLEGWNVGKLEGWNVGKLESWHVGKLGPEQLESWKVRPNKVGKVEPKNIGQKLESQHSGTEDVILAPAQIRAHMMST